MTFDAPGHYTPLFMSDEATSLAAGHRPCASCRRPAFNRFVHCWKTAHRIDPTTFVSISEIDTALHRARLDQRGSQKTHVAHLDDLPEGVFVTREAAPERPLLFWHSSLHPWNHEGYGKPFGVCPTGRVTVLTPAPTVKVLRAGYLPAVNMVNAMRWQLMS